MLRQAFKREINHIPKAPKKVKKDDIEITINDEQQIRELENLVFGGEEHLLEELACQAEKDLNNTDERVEKKKERKPVWEDEDDGDIVLESNVRGAHKEELYTEHLRKKLVDKVGTPKWASLDKPKRDDSDDSDSEILQTSGNLLSCSGPLASGIIDFTSCQDLTHDGWTKGIIKSTKFHPSSQVAMVANCNGTATLFQVDGKTNPKIQAVHFERFALESAHFTVDGEQIVVGSPEQNYLYCYDMMVGKIIKVPWPRGVEHCSTKRLFLSPDGKYLVICGRFGEMHLITVKSKEWVKSLKMNGDVQTVAFNSSGLNMYSHGENGEVYVWDMRSSRCSSKFVDEGCIKGTALAVSPNDQFLATGSDSGVVNLYNTSSLHGSSNPKPLKAVLNLTTQISSLKFNHTSEILAMSSPYKDNAVKLLHVPTTTVFSNFPSLHINLKKVNCLDISLNSGYLTFGNNMGRASLFRLKHFHNF